MKRFLHQRRLFAILFVAIATAAVLYVMQKRPDATSTTAVAAPAVATANVRAGVFLQRITVQGRVGSPQGDVTKLSFAEPGTLAHIDVHLGDSVRAGDPLAELDQRAVMLALDQAHTAVDAAGSLTSVHAKERLAAEHLQTLQQKTPATLSDTITAQSQAHQAMRKTTTDAANLKREQRLFAAGVIAHKDLRAAEDQLAVDQSDEQAAIARVAAAKQTAKASTATARTDLTVAQGDAATLEAQRAAAVAQEHSAQAAVDRATLRSPIDGVVVAVNKQLGETVDMTSPVIEIGSSHATNVTLAVPADQALKMHKGDAVDLQSSSGLHSIGHVTQVLPLIDGNTQTATVTVSTTMPNTVSGDAVTGSVTVARVKGIVVPSSAIVQDPQTGHTSVFVRTSRIKADASPFEQRDVTVAASDERQAVITSGLAVGEMIATTGAYALLAPNGG